MISSRVKLALCAGLLLACGSPSTTDNEGRYQPHGAILSSPTVSIGGMPTFSIKDYGAVCNGSTDDRAAIKAAFTAACAASGSQAGAVVYSPPGTCIVGKDPGGFFSLQPTCSNLTIMGVPGQSVWKHPAGLTAITAMLTLSSLSHVTIRGMVFDGNWGNAVTTVAGASNNQFLPGSGGSSTISVFDASAFPSGTNALKVVLAGSTQTITCTGKTATTLTGCTGGTGQMFMGGPTASDLKRGTVIGYSDSQASLNHSSQGGNPQNHLINIKGGEDILIENVQFREAYGDCIYLGAGATFAHNITIRNSMCTLTARNGISLAQWVEGIRIEHFTTIGNYQESIDMEPVETPVRDVVIEKSYLGSWWDQNLNGHNSLALTIEGGKTFASSDTTNANKIRIRDNTIMGSLLMENATDVKIEGNTIIDDNAGATTAPIVSEYFIDGVWITDNYIYDRSADISGGVTHVGAIDITWTGQTDIVKQPAGVHIARNEIHARNGQRGIHIEGAGAFGYGSNQAVIGSLAPVSGTLTAITSATNLVAGTATDGGAAWTTNQWVGWQLYTGGVAAVIVGNTATTLTLYQPSSPNFDPVGATWATPLGAPASTPSVGAYIITEPIGMVDIDDNQIDCGGEAGDGAGGIGIQLNASRFGGRLRVRGNTIRNATPYGIQISPVTTDNNRPFKFVQVTGNHGVDSQVTPTETEVVHFSGTINLGKLIVHGNTSDHVATVVGGLTSGTWLTNDGAVQQWAGYGSPEGVVTANVGSSYQRVDGGPSTTYYAKESGNAISTGWTAFGGSAGAQVPVWASQLGLVGGTYDPSALSASGVTATAGVVLLSKVRAFGTISKAIVQVGAGQVGATHVYVGLYKSDGTQSASMATATVDAATTLASAGVQTVTFANAVTPTVGDDVYVAVLVTGAPGTPLTLKGTVGNPAINGNLVAAQGVRSGVSGSGLTALPASFTLASIAASNTMSWVGLQ